MGDRRKSREYALQILYSTDAGKTGIDEAISLFWRANIESSDDVRSFAELLAKGAAGSLGEIDSLIESFSANWKLSRMTPIDRNILRMAIFELKNCNDIPVRVTLNEAIELAKQYGTEESGAFVNGILDQVAKQINKP